MRKLIALFVFGLAVGVASAQTKVPPAQGGTGIDTSHSTGCPLLTGGVWSITSSCGGGGGGGVNVTAGSCVLHITGGIITSTSGSC